MQRTSLGATPLALAVLVALGAALPRAQAEVRVPLRVLSFNLFGLPNLPWKTLAPFRAQRIQAFCQVLRDQAAEPTGWDVVLLQEVWRSESQRYLMSQCGYRYAAWSSRKSRDTGLLILSKLPITWMETRRFSRCGSFWHQWSDGECTVKKGVLLARVDLSSRMPPESRLRSVLVGNTHLVSPTKRRPYNDVRTSQVRELLAFVERHYDPRESEAFVMGGDFNLSEPGTPHYEPNWDLLQEGLAGFADASASLEPLPRAGLCTACSVNPLRNGKPDGGIIDHVFVAPPARLVDASITLAEPVVPTGVSREKRDHTRVGSVPISDHYGLATLIDLPVLH